MKNLVYGAARYISQFLVDLSDALFRKSEQVLLDINDHRCRMSIPKSQESVHYLQFRRPVTRQRRFFFVELQKLSESPFRRVSVAVHPIVVSLSPR